MLKIRKVGKVYKVNGVKYRFDGKRYIPVNNKKVKLARTTSQYK